MESTKKISVEEKHKEEILPEVIESARSVSVALNHKTTPSSIKKKRRLVLPSYSSAREEDKVQFLVVEEEQVQIPANVKEAKQVLNEEVIIPKEEEQVPVA